MTQRDEAYRRGETALLQAARANGEMATLAKLSPVEICERYRTLY